MYDDPQMESCEANCCRGAIDAKKHKLCFCVNRGSCSILSQCSIITRVK